MGFKNGAVIMMNPNTGEVLAMASSPTYDLNNPRESIQVLITEEEITGMSSDDKIDALNELWRNFCVSDTFEPGSTIKPFTVATGLEIGALKGDEPITAVVPFRSMNGRLNVSLMIMVDTGSRI